LSLTNDVTVAMY